ncbi:MAG: AbrB/MazE/SpoVT family DNA-binding domain-containing protein [Pseudomonadota bacterium]
MSKVTSKYQVSLPKALADEYGIVPGDDLEWTAAGDTLRVDLSRKREHPRDHRERLRLFDLATERQRERETHHHPGRETERGWRRDDLYDRP